MSYQGVTPVSLTDFGTEQKSIDRRRKLAELMQRQAVEPIEAPTSGGQVGPISPVSVLAKMLQGYMSGRNADKLDEREAALKKSGSEELAKAVAQFGKPFKTVDEAAPTNVDAGGEPAQNYTMKTPDTSEMLAEAMRIGTSDAPGASVFGAKLYEDTQKKAKNAELAAALEPGLAELPKDIANAVRTVAAIDPEAAAKTLSEYTIDKAKPVNPTNLQERMALLQSDPAMYGRIYPSARAAGGGGGGGDGAGFTPTGEADPESESILRQLNISYPAFMVLTGASAQLPRDRESRSRAFREAETVVNRLGKGVDVSTLASQYKANNAALATNVGILAGTRRLKDELGATLDNVVQAANDYKIGRISKANVVALFLGQQTNNPIANEYAFHLEQMRSELAAYNAGLQGRIGSNILESDYKRAEQTILNGLSSGGAQGFRKAINDATNKMEGVMQRNVDASRKAVWDLFGVGGNFKNKYPLEKDNVPGKPGITPEQKAQRARADAILKGVD